MLSTLRNLLQVIIMDRAASLSAAPSSWVNASTDFPRPAYLSLIRTAGGASTAVFSASIFATISCLWMVSRLPLNLE